MIGIRRGYIVFGEYMKKKKTYIIILAIVLICIIGGVVLYKSISNNKSVPYTDSTYSQVYQNAKDYADYLYEESMICYDDSESSAEVSSYTPPFFTDTNVRTEGVEEPDDVKTDGEYIYMTSSDGRDLIIYRVEDGKIQLISNTNILKTNQYFADLYIYGDKLIVVGTWANSIAGRDNEYTFHSNPNNETFIGIYDVSDKSKPVEEKTLYQDGWYISSRIIDGIIYTFSYDSVDEDNCNEKKVETYIPSVDGKVLLPEDIIAYEKMSYYFLVATSVNIKKEAFISQKAVMGGSTNPYVSENAIYCNFGRWDNWDNEYERNLIKISLDNGNLTLAAEGSFKGGLLNDYSIDEYNGYLRFVSTYRDENKERRNALYVLDENLDKVSVIEKLAPNETVKSARFMGDIAYFVTYKVVEQYYDPLFAVDLSDPENPKITDYMKLPGFSGYLHPYGENKLIGIGYNTDESTGEELCVKLSMFDITDPFDIKEECTCIFSACREANVLSDRNSLMYNPNDGTFGFGARVTTHFLDDESAPEPVFPENIDSLDLGFTYLVMDYDEEVGFKVVLHKELGEEAKKIDLNRSRGMVIGDYLYIVNSYSGIKSYDIEKYQIKDSAGF